MSKVGSSRKSPAAHASKLLLGTKMRGQDLNLYIVTKRADGTYFWDKYKGDRPSPNKHASDLALKTKLPGNDGYMYMVTKRSNGSKYWKKTDEKSTAKPTKEKLAAEIKSSRKNVIGKGPIVITIGEIYTTLLGSIFSISLKITEEFYQVLLKKPKYIRTRSDIGNAYIFGHEYPINTYKYIGKHNNDGAQTGIVDITNITQSDYDNIVNPEDDLWMKIFNPVKNKFYNWDERKLLPKIREDISNRILFVGSTDGGDVGAAVFAHFNKKGEVDGLIIDNNIFYHGNT